MVVADGQMGSVRSSWKCHGAEADATGAPEAVVEGRPQTLNIDASPTVRADDSVLLAWRLNTHRDRMMRTRKSGRAQLNERWQLTLESGKPMVISRSADPGSSRRITVEVTATVMK